MTGQLQSEDQEVALVHLLKSSTTYHLAKKVAREALEENASWKTSKVEQTPLLPKEAQEKILQIQESLRGHLRHVQSRHTQDSRKLSLRFQGTLKSDL